MERDIDLKQVSDGKLYSANDIVKIGCNGCAGCSECCRAVADTIILDPYDIYQLEKCLLAGFDALLETRIELSVVEGIILPHLLIRPGGAGCTFLQKDGRCGIHDSRPGFCRMFPLGRIYEDNDFRYFLQVHECPYPNKTKVKVKKWLEIPELSRYEAFIKDWHYFVKDVQKLIKETQSDLIVKNLNMYLLNQFYAKAYEISDCDGTKPDFYRQFYERLEKAREVVRNYR